jgi:hypothetical protein
MKRNRIVGRFNMAIDTSFMDGMEMHSTSFKTAGAGTGLRRWQRLGMCSAPHERASCDDSPFTEVTS